MTEIPAAVTDAAAAILRLQAQIQIATCITCHGRCTQAVVLEPFASQPCTRCHGEGVTHDVPPWRYDAVLAAVLDALGGADPERIAERLKPLLAADPIP